MRILVIALCALVEGRLHDPLGHAVPAATVYLQSTSTERKITAETDADGQYRFPSLPAGTYILRAGDAATPAFAVKDEETKIVDLTLPDTFFDEPNFIVAGVTDATNHGGHGSDTVLRSAEGLAKATASLSAKSPSGDPLETAREYQRAAESNPSEENLFNWGSELLKHRAYEPASEVFTKGNRLYPRSLRMLLGLAAASYARGAYDQAARQFFAACDLEPGNPQPYLFLGQAQSSEITQLDGYLERMRRFAERHSRNAPANYYYAVSLWQRRQTPERAQELLEQAIRLDPSYGVAYLQLGILYSDRNDSGRAIAAYRKAIEVSPQLTEPHYRLGQAYGRIGEKEKARKELDIYEQMSRNAAREAEDERRAIQQFVIQMR